MRHALFTFVVFVERRKGDGHRTLDRRRTYIDVVERVLGASLTTDTSGRMTSFRRVYFGQVVIGSTVSEVHIYFLGDFSRQH
jgi:hypothetical protein